MGPLLLTLSLIAGSADEPVRAQLPQYKTLKEAAEARRVAFPPKKLYIRIFKQEKQLEVWVPENGGVYVLLNTYPVAAASGVPGPKRREGDKQVPEGVYFVERFNPTSRYCRSLGLNYPNTADRVHADKNKPGSDIFIHGSDVSIGCIAMTDRVILDLYPFADHARRFGKIPVHIFPCRMTGKAYASLLLQFPQHASFWKDLEPVCSKFEGNHKLPFVSISKGRYICR